MSGRSAKLLRKVTGAGQTPTVMLPPTTRNRPMAVETSPGVFNTGIFKWPLPAHLAPNSPRQNYKRAKRALAGLANQQERAKALRMIEAKVKA